MTISPIGSPLPQETNPVLVPNLNELPPDMLRNIFSFSSSNEMIATSSVNRDWKKISKEAEIDSIINFVGYLTVQLGAPSLELQQILLDLENGVLNLFGIRGRIGAFLVTLPRDLVLLLRNNCSIKQPNYLINIFEEALLVQILAEQNPLKRDYDLKEFSEQMINEFNLKMALKASNNILEEPIRDCALMNICTALIQQRFLVPALQLVAHIQDKDNKDLIFRKLVDASYAAGDFEGASRIVVLIQDQETQQYAREDLEGSSSESDEFDSPEPDEVL